MWLVENALDLDQIRAARLPAGGGRILADLIRLGGAGNHRSDRSPSQQCPDRHLNQRQPALDGKPPQSLKLIELLLGGDLVAAGEPRTGRCLRSTTVLSGQQAAG